MPEEQQPNVVTTIGTAYCEPIGIDSFLQGVSDAHGAAILSALMSPGIWATATPTAANTTAQNTPAATEQPPRNDR